MTYASIYFLVFYFILKFTGCVSKPEVITPYGKVIGINMETRYGRNINAFLGIPYAKAPIGKLRFKNPIPSNSFNGTFNANIAGPACLQVDDNHRIIGSENCLFLNVYSPQINTIELFPTMVYIHGGGFQFGHAKPDVLGPQYILDKDVVLVTLQYRLGVFGFLSTGDAEAPGNFGLKDQAMALRWVQQNIRYFGGDPNSVTIFGQSSGSVSVNFQVLSSSTKGLFHRYIAQSGSALCPWAFADIKTYKNYAFNLGKLLNCPTDKSKELIECLQKVNPEKLIRTREMFSGVQQVATVSWVPTNEPNVEGAFLSEQPIEAILKNKMQDLPSISGVTKDEGLIVTDIILTNKTIYTEVVSDLDFFLNFLTASYIKNDNARKVAINLRDFYFKNIDVKDQRAVLLKITQLLEDVAFFFPQMLQIQFLKGRIKNPNYFYSFEYRGTFSKTSVTLKNNTDLGVTHGDELIYLFPTTPQYFQLPRLKMSKADEKMIDIVVELWTNFATFGIPKTRFGSNPFIWKPYSSKNDYLKIGSKEKPVLKLANHFVEERMNFWALQIFKYIVWSLGK